MQGVSAEGIEAVYRRGGGLRSGGRFCQIVLLRKFYRVVLKTIAWSRASFEIGQVNPMRVQGIASYRPD
jgi:hypothetical protein